VNGVVHSTPGVPQGATSEAEGDDPDECKVGGMSFCSERFFGLHPWRACPSKFAGGAPDDTAGVASWNRSNCSPAGIAGTETDDAASGAEDVEGKLACTRADCVSGA